MRVVMFYHSLVSDWCHDTAHFLRGIATEFQARGHDVRIYEPADAWSRVNLERDHGAGAIRAFSTAYPRLSSTTYTLETLDVDRALAGADLVVVHEWSDPQVVARIGAHHARAQARPYVLLFHDARHRSMSDPASLAACDLRRYDGVLASGDSIARAYLARGWAGRAWTWHEAADIRVFYPRAPMSDDPGDRSRYDGDVVWIGNVEDDERWAEIEALFVEPVWRLGLRAAVFGVGYTVAALTTLASAGVAYGGWLANYDVPAVLARYRVTVHIPRAPYVSSLPDVPPIRVFEAMACGIPLVSARWADPAGAFTAGTDFLVARNTAEMTMSLRTLSRTPSLRRRLAEQALQTIRARHTCRHRVDELLRIVDEVAVAEPPAERVAVR